MKNKFKELFGADLRSLALLRMAMAALVLMDLAERSMDIGAFYTDAGVLPRRALFEYFPEPARFSIHLISGVWQIQAILFLAAAIFAVALFAGYRTRSVSFLSWFFLVSLQVRNPLIYTLGDQMLRLMLFWGIFLPWGSRWSVDSHSNPVPQESSSHVFSMATFAYAAQIIFMYTFAAYCKSGAEWRKEYTAVFYTLNLDFLASSLGNYLLNFPSLLKLMTFFVVWLETLGPVFLFFPFWTGPIRMVALSFFIFMHLGIMATMTIGFLPWVSIAALFGLVPSFFWDKIIPAFKTQPSLEPISRSPSTKKAFSVVCDSFIAASLVYSFFWNIWVVPQSWFKMPPSAVWVGKLLYLEQGWNVFAPYPPKEDGWFVMPGTLKNGESVDLFRGGEAVRWEKPRLVSKEFKNDRWAKYLEQVNMKIHHGLRAYYAHYLCRQWNSHHPPERALRQFEMYYMREQTLPGLHTSPPQKILMWSHKCAG